ncbi:hypothetical protein [Ferrovibrio terrae]|uniref:hypothetical protein n=1 Tax=Ferrovibrio terrae TaxID=2594003 RepID=UPI003137E080
MKAVAELFVPQYGLASALIVVFPSLAVQPDEMMAAMAGFLGSKLVIVSDTNASASTLPPVVQHCLAIKAGNAVVTTVSTPMFGNRRGLVLPVDLAVEIVAGAGLSDTQDRLLLTGCYRGWLPGSIDVLAEALTAIHFSVDVDTRISRR